MHRLLFFCLLPGGSLLIPEIASAESAVKVTDAAALVRLWQADQHLYVKGDVGLSQDRMGALETWLDANAPHWTIFLTNNAAGETWQDRSSSQTYSGMDAVENALGRGLPAQTAFGQLAHPETGERDGAWLVIFLNERKFSYWASDVYDRRGLGEDHWQGNLDSAARQAMRGGGRIAAAVQDTVTSIDSELNRRIAREAEAKRQETERLASLRARTVTVIADMRQAIKRLTGQAAELKRGSPQASGTLTSPPASRWMAELDEAAGKVASGDSPAATPLLEKLQNELNTWEGEFAVYRTAPATMQALELELDRMTLHPWSADARPALLEARTLLRQATDAYAKADQGFTKPLTEAAARLNAAQVKDTATRGLATAHAQLLAEAENAAYPENSAAASHVMLARQALSDYARQRDADASGGNLLTQAPELLARAGRTHAAQIRRAETLRQTAQIGGAAGSAALLLGGWAGHRRRRKVKEQAVLAFKEWEEALQKKTTELFSLLDRAGRAVGTSAILERSGWTGTTRQLAQQIIQDVDQLFVMSSALDQVLERARALIQPANPLTRTRNLISGRRYEAALDLLEKERIQFTADSQIPAILSTAPGQEWKGLLGRREDCEPFVLTFPALNEAFNHRASRALSGLDRIETAWTRISSALTELDRAIAAATGLEKQVNAAEATDQRFGVNPVFAELLPSARADSAAAAKLGVSDPVQALEGPWTEGFRRAGDAALLCQAMKNLRGNRLPLIQENQASLTAAGRDTKWIGNALDGLSKDAEKLAATAVTSSISEALSIWENAAGDVLNQASEAVELTQRACSKALPQIQALEDRTTTERVRLAGLLVLTPDKILIEAGRNPSDFLHSAQGSHDAALTELDRGDTAAARASLEDCASRAAAGNDLINAAIKAQEGHPARMQLLTDESSRLASLLPGHAEILDTLRRGWAPDALRPAASDLGFPDPDETVADNLLRAEDLLAKARTEIGSGDAAYREGSLLTLVDLHDQAEAHHAAAAAELLAIVHQRDAIQAIVLTNAAERIRLTRLHAALHDLANEPVTMQSTRDKFRSVSDDLDAALAAAALTGISADPFAAVLVMKKTGDALANMEQRLQSDRELFAEVSRSIAFAGRQLEAALPLIKQAGSDHIPDSKETWEAREALSSLQKALATAEAALQQPHGDWPMLDRQADQLAADAAEWRVKLNAELARASATMEALQRATERVRAAGGWSGALGVRITGLPGSRYLELARHAFDQGQYDIASQEADAAHREAQAAINEAEAEQRRRQQEQERAEERRRRDAASHRASSFASSASSSFGDSSSRSSFSSGSGASRSGW